MANLNTFPDHFLLTEPGAAFTELEGCRMADEVASERSSRNLAPYLAERFDVIVIGAGQAGLSTGYHLARQGLNFVILEAADRIGEQWRNRWDSLRLFTPAKFDGLDGMRFPANPNAFPTKDQMADYLEAYARRLDLPVRTGVRVETLEKKGEDYVVTAGGRRFEANQLIVAAASYQKPRIPDFASDLDPAILQLHSNDYRNPSQLHDGPVLLVGAGNSGAEIAMDIARKHKVWLSGRDVGAIPFKIDGFLGRNILVRLVIRGLFHRVLTTATPLGRKFRPLFLSQGGPLIRTKPRHLAAASVERIARVAGVQNGLPRLEDGRILNAANVVWCTGFGPGLSWIRLPIFDADGRPRHCRGIVPEAPGLYFVGLHFQHAPSSTMVHGVSRDARKVVDALVAKVREASC